RHRRTRWSDLPPPPASRQPARRQMTTTAASSNGHGNLSPEALEAGNEGGQRRSAILVALDELGPTTAGRIAKHLRRATGNASTRLRQLEQEGRVRRTGESVSSGRGGPQIVWDLCRPGDEPTSPDTPVDGGPGPVQERLRALAEQVAASRAKCEV